ncbi:hypothetical protein ACFQ3N_02015 [Virgibacillus byunsanensis]|uniref:Uncharacterized protein n=1 Tax=Virgibacillus byunsanensis TaxID=570945 RepID=A0ABW3LFR1_9BACI
MDWVEEQEADQGMDHNKDQHANYSMNHPANQHTDQDTASLIKLNKDKKKPNHTKQNNNITTTFAFVFYQENFGVISPFVSDAMLNWVNDMGEELVLETTKQAFLMSKQYKQWKSRFVGISLAGSRSLCIFLGQGKLFQTGLWSRSLRTRESKNS